MALDPDLYFEISFPEPDGAMQRRAFKDPVEVLTAHNLVEVPAVIDSVERGVASGLTAVGFVSYEAAPAFDEKLSVYPPTEFPLALFGLFSADTTLGNCTEHCTDQRVMWNLDTSIAQYAKKVAEIR